MKRFMFTLSLCCLVSASAQQPRAKALVCDENAGCAHQFINGLKFKILTGDGLTVTASMVATPKYIRADISVLNGTTASIDVMPTTFQLEEVDPKQKSLAYVDAGKIMLSAQKRVAWGNALTAMGANMQRQQTTTNTNSTGTVNATGSNGTYTTGTYNGSSTSTTSSPDNAAKARADETIRQNNAALAALNNQLAQVVLRANTVLPNQSVRGLVFFERDKKAQSVVLSIPAGDTVYKFPFTFIRQ